MNPAIKQKWITLLRSGEVKQGFGQLKCGDCYCPLGVLCLIAEKEGIGKFVEDTFVISNFSYEDYALPFEVIDWSELSDTWGCFQDDSIPALNDGRKLSFNIIAAYIEKYF